MPREHLCYVKVHFSIFSPHPSTYVAYEDKGPFPPVSPLHLSCHYSMVCALHPFLIWLNILSFPCISNLAFSREQIARYNSCNHQCRLSRDSAISHSLRFYPVYRCHTLTVFLYFKSIRTVQEDGVLIMEQDAEDVVPLWFPHALGFLIVSS